MWDMPNDCSHQWLNGYKHIFFYLYINLYTFLDHVITPNFEKSTMTSTTGGVATAYSS
jgi:hypothetical protein